MGQSGARRRGHATRHHQTDAIATVQPVSMPDEQPWASVAGFGTLALVFVSTRLLVLLLMRPGGFFGEWTDFNYFKEMAELAGQGYYPYVHYWVEYPPLTPWLFVAAYKLSLLAPVWRHPMLWFQLPLGLLLVLADFGTLWLIRRIGTRVWGAERGLQCAWIYAGLFLPLYANLVWFDSLTVFLLMLALDLVISRRPWLAGLACGAGVAIKVFPILLIPVAVRVFRGVRLWAAFALAAAVVPILSMIPFVFGDRTMLVASIKGILNRRSWETIWALMDGFYGTGGVPALADRLLYAESASWTNPSRLPWIPISIAFAVIYLVVWWVSGRAPHDQTPTTVSSIWKSIFGGGRPDLSPRITVALAGFTVALFLIYNKGFSQQFNLLLLPFIVLLAPNVRGILLAIALIVDSTFVEGYLWVNVFPDNRDLLRFTVVFRTLLFGLFAVWTAAQVWPWLAAIWVRIRRPALGGVAAIAIFATLYGGWSLSDTYHRQSLAQSPRLQAVQAVLRSGTDTVVIYSSESLHVAVHPFVAPRGSLVVSDPKLPERKGPMSLHSRLTALTADRAEAVLVTEPDRIGEPVTALARRWLVRNGMLIESRVESSLVIERYSLMATAAPGAGALAQFGSSLVIDSISPPPTTVAAGGTARVGLRWRAFSSVDRDYTVFAHFVQRSPDGERIVAQKDSQPVDGTYPTNGWVPGESVGDDVLLNLPVDLAPGDYFVALGLYYVPTLERLPVTGSGAAGIAVESDRVVVGPIRVTGRLP